MSGPGVSILRNRGKRSALNIVREFDAFPKIEEKYTEPTNIGGTRMYYMYISIRYTCTYLIWNNKLIILIQKKNILL